MSLRRLAAARPRRDRAARRRRVASGGRPLSRRQRHRADRVLLRLRLRRRSSIFAVAMHGDRLCALFGRAAPGRSSRGRGRWHLLSYVLLVRCSPRCRADLPPQRARHRLRQLTSAQASPPARRASTPGRPVANPRNARVRWDEIAVVLVLVGGSARRARRSGRTPSAPPRPWRLGARRKPSRWRSTSRSTTSATSPTSAARSSPPTRGWSTRSRASACRAGRPRRRSSTSSVPSASSRPARRACAVSRTSSNGQSSASMSRSREMRDDAIDALVAVRDELATARRGGGRHEKRARAGSRRRSRSSRSSLVVLLGVRPVSVHQILAVYVLVLAAVALGGADASRAELVEHAAARCFERALIVRNRRRSRPPELVRMEREITLGTRTPAICTSGCCRSFARPRRTPRGTTSTSSAAPTRQEPARRRRMGARAPRSPRADRPQRAGHLAAARPRHGLDAGAALMELAELRDRASRVLDEVERAIVGKRDALELILLALLSDGHVLLEDYPGLAKTMIARSFAQATSLQFSRIQFTPDLMPSDVTGSSIFDQRRERVHVPAGPDLRQPPPRRRDQPRPTEDAGRAPRGDAGAAGDDRGRDAAARRAVPRARDAEPDRVRGHVSAAGGAARPLPDADRRRLSEPRPRDRDARAAARPRRRRARAAVRSSTPRRSSRCSARSSRCTSPTPIEGYIVDLVAATRASQRLAVGASPRGSLALLKLARAKAALAGRDFVVPEDVKAIAIPALAHRLTLRPGALGAARARRGRRRRGARDGADAAGRGRPRSRWMTRFVSPRLAAVRRPRRGRVARGPRARARRAGRGRGAVRARRRCGRCARARSGGPGDAACSIASARSRAKTVTATIELSSPSGADRVDVFLPLPARAAAPSSQSARDPTRSRREQALELRLHCARCGAFALGPLLVRARDRLGFHSWEPPVGGREPLRVYPNAETVRTMLAPLETQVFVGNQVSRAKRRRRSSSPTCASGRRATA